MLDQKGLLTKNVLKIGEMLKKVKNLGSHQTPPFLRGEGQKPSFCIVTFPQF